MRPHWMHEVTHRSFRVMPTVVLDQRTKFDNDELLRRLSQPSEVRFTGFLGQRLSERREKFKEQILKEGFTDVAIVGQGINLRLIFDAKPWVEKPNRGREVNRDTVDFESEPGKVWLMSRFILNGVAVIWKGQVSLDKLEGIGHLEFDEERAEAEKGRIVHHIADYESRYAPLVNTLQLQELEVAGALVSMSQASSPCSNSAATSPCQS